MRIALIGLRAPVLLSASLLVGSAQASDDPAAAWTADGSASPVRTVGGLGQ